MSFCSCYCFCAVIVKARIAGIWSVLKFHMWKMIYIVQNIPQVVCIGVHHITFTNISLLQTLILWCIVYKDTISVFQPLLNSLIHLIFQIKLGFSPVSCVFCIIPIGLLTITGVYWHIHVQWMTRYREFTILVSLALYPFDWSVFAPNRQ